MIISLKFKASRILFLGAFLIWVNLLKGQSSLGFYYGKNHVRGLELDIKENTFLNKNEVINGASFFMISYQKKIAKYSKNRLFSELSLFGSYHSMVINTQLKLFDEKGSVNLKQKIPHYNLNLGIEISAHPLDLRRVLFNLSLGINYGFAFYPLFSINHDYNLFELKYSSQYSDYLGVLVLLNTQHFISKNISIGPFVSIPILARFSYTTEVYVRTSDNEEFNYNVTTSGSSLCYGLSLRRHFNTKGSSD